MSLNLLLFISVHSLKLTANASENRPGSKRKVMFQPSIFQCYDSFREGKQEAGSIFLSKKHRRKTLGKTIRITP